MAQGADAALFTQARRSEKLSEHQVPCGVMKVRRPGPALNDKTMEHVLEAAAAASASAQHRHAGCQAELVLFKEWLWKPPPAPRHVMSIVRQMLAEGKRSRLRRPHGPALQQYADLMEKRFDIACRRFNLVDHGAGREPPELDHGRFRRARMRSCSALRMIGLAGLEAGPQRSSGCRSPALPARVDVFGIKLVYLKPMGCYDRSGCCVPGGLTLGAVHAGLHAHDLALEFLQGMLGRVFDVHDMLANATRCCSAAAVLAVRLHEAASFR